MKCTIKFGGKTYETANDAAKAIARYLPLHKLSNKQTVPAIVNDIDSQGITSDFNATRAENVEAEAAYIVLDTETTGLKANSQNINMSATAGADKILQLSWLILDKNGKVLERKSFLTKDYTPENGIIPNSAIHNITVEHLGYATHTTEDIFNKFLKGLVVKGIPIVGHNVNFDIDMLTAAIKDDKALGDIKFTIIDTLASTSKKLSDLTISSGTYHNAAVDVEATSHLFISQNPELLKSRTDVYVDNGKVGSVQQTKFFDFKNDAASGESDIEAKKAEIEKLEKEKQEELNYLEKIAAEQLLSVLSSASIKGDLQEGNFNGGIKVYTPIKTLQGKKAETNDKSTWISFTSDPNDITYSAKKQEIDKLNSELYSEFVKIKAKHDAEIAQKQAELKALERSVEPMQAVELAPTHTTIRATSTDIDTILADNKVDTAKPVYILNPDLNPAGMVIINPTIEQEVVKQLQINDTRIDGKNNIAANTLTKALNEVKFLVQEAFTNNSKDIVAALTISAQSTLDILKSVNLNDAFLQKIKAQFEATTVEAYKELAELDYYRFELFQNIDNYYDTNVDEIIEELKDYNNLKCS